MRSTVARVVLALAVAACGGKDDKAASTTTAEPAMTKTTPVEPPPAEIQKPPPPEGPPQPEPPPAPPEPMTTSPAPVDRATLDATIKADKAALKKTKDKHEQARLYARLAYHQWERSCAAPQDGLCTKMRAPEKACATQEIRTAVKRKKGDAKAAATSYKAAQKLWAAGAVLHADADADPTKAAANAALAEAVALAWLAAADRLYEEYLAIAPLKGLDFSEKKAKASAKKFDTWFTAVTKAAAKAQAEYEKIAQDQKLVELAPWVYVAAADRVGDLSQHLGQNVQSLMVPADVAKDPEAVAAYCETVAGKARPLFATAAQTWHDCTEAAARLRVEGPWPDRCAASLAEAEPAPAP